MSVNEMYFDSNFWSAIAGAIVGGAIGLVGQWIVLRSAKQQRNEDREAVRKALGHSLLYKTIRIFTSNHHLLEHAQDASQHAENEGEPEDFWKYLTPLANYPDRVNFTAEEMTLLLSLKNDILFNALVSLDAVHNSLIDGFRTFGERKAEFTNMLPPADRFEGRRGSVSLTKEQFQRLQPQMVELKELANDLRGRARKDYLSSREALDALTSELSAKLAMTYKVELPPAIFRPERRATRGVNV